MAINKRLIPKDCSDAFLVKGYYDNDPVIKEALGRKLSDYYWENYYGIFPVKKEGAKEIFQMSITALLINIKTRRVYVDEDGVLIGTDNKPFSSTLTSYFMSIAKNSYKEWKRKLGDGTDKDPDRLPNSQTKRKSGISVPCEKFKKVEGEDRPRLFWFMNDKSTGIEVKMEVQKGRKIKQMPYISKDLHWWVGYGDKAKDLGSLYNDILYDDEEITTLTRVARSIAQMKCMCKEILTYSLYFGKSNNEIAFMKGYNTDTLKSKKHDCLEKLNSLVNVTSYKNY